MEIRGEKLTKELEQVTEFINAKFPKLRNCTVFDFGGVHGLGISIYFTDSVGPGGSQVNIFLDSQRTKNGSWATSYNYPHSRTLGNAMAVAKYLYKEIKGLANA